MGMARVRSGLVSGLAAGGVFAVLALGVGSASAATPMSGALPMAGAAHQAAEVQDVRWVRRCWQERRWWNGRRHWVTKCRSVWVGPRRW